MHSQRIVILSSSVVLGITLANANPVQAPGWAMEGSVTSFASEQTSPAPAGAGGGATTIGIPQWAPAVEAASSGSQAPQAPLFPASSEVQSASAPAPAWEDDWNEVANTISTGFLPKSTSAAPTNAPATLADANAAAQPEVAGTGGNPFAEPAPTASAAPPSNTANPFELPESLGVRTSVAAPATQQQPYQLPSTQSGPATESEAAGQQGPDLRALRYYASQRNLVRVGAEIRRLKALYPTWQVPDDLFSPVGGAEEQALWDLYSIGNYAEIRRRIASMQVANPQWRPSSDLLTKLDLGEARVRIASASNAGSWGQVISYASTSKDLLVCTNMDSLWRVAEALVKTQKLAKAFDLYSYILTNCADPHERLATFQKASVLLPAKGLDALLPLAATAEEQTSFSSIRFDRLRGRMGAVASGQEEGEISEDELQQFARYIDATRSAEDATLFGWYLYRLEYFEDSAAWFKAAAQVTRDPKPLEGYVLSLRNLDQADKAEEVAYKNRSKSPELAKVYVELVAEQLTDEDRDDKDSKAAALTGERLKQYEDTVDDLKSPLGAQAIGWYYIDEKELATAEEWFDKSVKWEPTEGGVVGQAVIAARAKRMAELQKIKSTYQDEFPALKDFKVWKAYSKKNYVYKKKRYKKVAAKKPKKSFLQKLFES